MIAKLVGVDVSPISLVGPSTNSEFVRYVAAMKRAVEEVNQEQLKDEFNAVVGRKKVDELIAGTVTVNGD